MKISTYRAKIFLLRLYMIKAYICSFLTFVRLYGYGPAGNDLSGLLFCVSLPRVLKEIFVLIFKVIGHPLKNRWLFY